MNENPFLITKAFDFNDREIASTWVNWEGDGPAFIADPRSPMPVFLTGSKGGGRTHLLRNLSYALQRVRHSASVAEGVQSDGYLGIYFLCSGLNSSRFSGKDQSDEKWATVFEYYMEIWLGYLVIDILSDLFGRDHQTVDPAHTVAFADAVCKLFDVAVPLRTPSLPSLLTTFRHLQRELDVAINNAALDGRLECRVLATPGQIVFGIPREAARHFPSLGGLTFTYLIDEYENLTEPQQRYVNTLVREKERPTTLLVGSRSAGIRTQQTLSAREENREGSEFDLIVLEHRYRQSKRQYTIFCRKIIERRLAACDLPATAGELADRFTVPRGTLEERATAKVASLAGERPWIDRFRQQVCETDYAPHAEDLLKSVRFPTSPLHEKLAILLLYRHWAGGDELPTVASEVRARVMSLLQDSQPDPKTKVTYKHYREDLYAQLLVSLKHSPEYYGLASFIRMSGYLPRNLIVLLKEVTRWSLFLGETPFRGSPVSLRAQRKGIAKASEWFMSDAKGIGRAGDDAVRAVRRLGNLFQHLRYADKPVEVGCSTFATDAQGLSARARTVLDSALTQNLLIDIPIGRSERNTRVLHYKYQLNPMLAPRFGLSLARRGSASLPSTLLNSVFDPTVAEHSFGRERDQFVARYQAPFSTSNADQVSLDLE